MHDMMLIIMEEACMLHINCNKHTESFLIGKIYDTTIKVSIVFVA